jgi:hypothetical protein
MHRLASYGSQRPSLTEGLLKLFKDNRLAEDSPGALDKARSTLLV